MTRPLHVLHLEDLPRDARVIRDRLELDGVRCDIVVTDRKDAFESALAHEAFDLILCDFNIPGYDGVSALKTAMQVQPDVPVILLSGTLGEEEAVKVLHMGATDYLLKSSLDRLAPAVHRAIREAHIRRVNAGAEQALREREQSLRESEERTRFALSAARTGVWEIECATGCLTWSDTMSPLFGIAAVDAPRRADEFIQLIHPDDRDAAEAALTRALAGERAFGIDFRALWPDGSAHWVQLRAQLVCDAANTPIRLLGIASDIDERRGLEAQLRQSHKLEALGQMAGGIAHDFNNVLTVILGFSELRLMEMDDNDPARNDLIQIKNAGTRAAGLTRQLLAFSRRQLLLPEILDLNTLIIGIEPMLRLLVAEHVDVTVSPLGEKALVKMDPTQVEQILVNLAVNAVDAMPRGGKLVIETSTVTLDNRPTPRLLPLAPGPYVVLSVRDSGVGMSDAIIRHIFEPFFTTKEVGRGTGLGLATVYGIVKQSGGDIAVRSAMGKGTAFDIYLPQVSGAVTYTTAKEHSNPEDDTSRCTETILLVEDDDGVRLLTRIALERLGYHVLPASNPRQARNVANAFDGPIHLMLSDVIMPESHGAPLLESLVAARPTIRALYMSGYAEEAIRDVLLVGETPFIRKPFTPDALAGKVRDVLDAPATQIR